jgi:serine/threonine-protein kinase
VAEAHSLGIVHRDLKPENLFLARLPDGTRSVKVLDFGISKSMVIGSADNRSLTQSSTIMGSPLYMSPEQMRAPRTVDTRTDIWSLGAIIYELLSGNPPYVADTLPQLCAKMLESDPTPLRIFRPDVDLDLERTVTRCLARNVNDRWQSMGELAQALLPYASRSARIHVERAGRVLNTTENNARMAQMPLQSRDPAHGTPTRQSARGLDAAAMPERARTPVSNAERSDLRGSDPARSPVQGLPIMPVTDTGNRASWENSRGGRQASGSAHPSRAGWKVALMISGGAAALLALGGFVWSMLRQQSASTITPVLSAAAADIAPSPTRSAVEAMPTAASLPSSPVEIVGQDGGAAAEEAAKPPVEAARPGAAPTTTREPAPELRIRKTAQPAANPPPSGKGLTDFGGRR